MDNNWRKIDEAGNYLISREGKVWSVRAGRVLACTLTRKGYLQTKIDGRLRLVHQLVAEAFLSTPPPGRVAKHRNEDQSDNYVQNLYWGRPGRNRNSGKLSGDDVVEIFEERQADVPLRVLAARYSVSLSAISRAWRRHFCDVHCIGNERLVPRDWAP